MSRAARMLAMAALSHAAPYIHRYGGKRAGRWFFRYTVPIMDRLIKANLRDYRRTALGVSGS